MTLTLHPYQQEGLSIIQGRFNNRALIAFEMGLGKTIISLKAVEEKNEWPGVVVVPATLKKQWQREAQTLFGIESCILSGQSPYITEDMKDKKLYIVNYEILEYWLSFLRRRNLKFVIGDEIQRIGNINSKTCRYFTALCGDIKSLYFLSGTPAVNCPWELFPALSLLNPGVFDSPWSYGMDYCDGKKEYGKWNFKGAKNHMALHELLLQACMGRRTKADIGMQIPPIHRMVKILELSNQKEYTEAETDLIGWLERAGKTVQAMKAAKMERLTRFTYLKHLAAVGKLPYVIQWLEGFLQESDQKAIIGTIHNDIIDALEEHPWTTGTVSIRGSKSPAQKEAAEQQFKKDKKTRFMFGQVKSVGVGLNVPEAGAAILAELPFTSSACKQLEARANRVTSVNPLDAVYLIAGGSIEEKLCKLIQRKEGIADVLLDGVIVQDASLTIYDQLQLAMLEGRS